MYAALFRLPRTLLGFDLAGVRRHRDVGSDPQDVLSASSLAIAVYTVDTNGNVGFPVVSVTP